MTKALMRVDNSPKGQLKRLGAKLLPDSPTHGIRIEIKS